MKDFIWYFGFFHIVLYTALGICTIYKRYLAMFIDLWNAPPSVVIQKISEFRKY